MPLDPDAPITLSLDLSQQFFSLGELRATPGALEQMTIRDLVDGLQRHVRCDWGEVGDEDQRANNLALLDGGRVQSVYLTAEQQTRFWIITEADRSATTVLLPEEY